MVNIEIVNVIFLNVFANELDMITFANENRGYAKTQLKRIDKNAKMMFLNPKIRNNVVSSTPNDLKTPI